MRRLIHKHWWWIFAGSAFFVVAAYFVNFGSPHSRLSPLSEDWGHFGEYVGGMFGMLAFIGVLVTIDLQRRQVDQLNNQSTADELMQLCRNLAKNIDDRLDRELPGSRELEFVRSANCSADYQGLVNAAGSDNPALQSQLGAAVTDMGADIFVTQALQKMAAEMDYLANCADEMEGYGGSRVIVNYYRKRYGDLAYTIVQFDVELKTTNFWQRPES